MDVVTWNLQGMSVRENNRDRLRRAIDRMERMSWEIVCVTELRAEAHGVVWMGEEESKVVLVHGMKSGVVLRSGALANWIECGQRKWMYERVAAVHVFGMRVVSAYQPVWRSDLQGMHGYRRDLEEQLRDCAGERLVIGGDFNACVGRGNVRDGVTGRYGVGRVNEAGRDMIEWCEENELVYVNSFMQHKRRGTWFNLRYGRWYELDGFVARKSD